MVHFLQANGSEYRKNGQKNGKSKRFSRKLMFSSSNFLVNLDFCNSGFVLFLFPYCKMNKTVANATLFFWLSRPFTPELRAG
jgi:hypothetical protein